MLDFFVVVACLIFSWWVMFLMGHDQGMKDADAGKPTMTQRLADWLKEEDKD